MDTRETVDTFSRTLPPALRAAVTPIAITEILYAIGRTERLAIDVVGGLADETVRFITGETHSSKDFLSRLAALLDGDRSKTAAVAEAVNARIFLPIRDAMRGMKSPPSAPPPQPAPPSPPLRMPESAVIRPLPTNEIIASIRVQPEGIALTPPPSGPWPPTPPAVSPRPAQSYGGPAGQAPPAPKPPAIALPPVPSPADGKPQPAAMPTPKSTGPPAPLITPIGFRPAGSIVTPPPVPPPPPARPKPLPPPPPQATYERARQAAQLELKAFRESQPAAVTKPALPVTTGQELARRIEQFRQPPPPSPTAQVPPGKPSPAKLPPEGPPLKLPAEKIPKPPAPEKYTADPYREPAE